MTPFIRFIFVVLIVGIVLNLAIVGLANVTGERQRAAEVRKEREAFTKLLGRVHERLRRADIGVEWQTLDAAENVIESSLLVRQYYLTQTDEVKPLPIVRVRVPGDRVMVDGLLLEFDNLFASSNTHLEVFRGKRLAYFDHIYVEGQKPEEWYRLLEESQPPVLTGLQPVFSPEEELARIDEAAAAQISSARGAGREDVVKVIEDKRDAAKTLLIGEVRKRRVSSLVELQMWQRLWEGVKEPSRRPPGMAVTHLPPAVREMRRGQVYAAFVGPDGVSIEPQTATGLLSGMREEADKLGD